MQVALPWLAGAVRDARETGSLPSLAALRWLAARGRATPYGAADWRSWLLGAAGEPDPGWILRDWPAGRTLAASSGVAVAAGPETWACAQPVHLATGIDHLRMAPLQRAVLSDDEAVEIAASVNAHFADRGLELVVRVRDAWAARFLAPVESTTHDPVEVRGHNVHDFMPGGPDGAKLRSLMNEIQMLLHEHPVNERRAQRLESPVNAIWFWGFDSPSMAPRQRSAVAGQRHASAWPALVTDDPWMYALWHLHGAEVEWFGPPATVVDCARVRLIAVSRPPGRDSAEALQQVESEVFAPLCTAFREARIGQLAVLTGDAVIALGPGARFAFWRTPIEVAKLFA